MQRVLRSLDIKPQIDPYFLKRTSLGGSLSILACILSVILICSMFLGGTKFPTSFEIDTSIDNSASISLELTFSNPICDFLSVSGRDINGGDLYISPTSYKSLSSQDITEINNRLNRKERVCYVPNSIRTPQGAIKSCDSCISVIATYFSLGFKVSKLLTQLDQCKNYSAKEYAEYYKKSYCKRELTFDSPGMKFEVTVDSTLGYQFLTSDDFESAFALDLFDLNPTSITIGFNGHSAKKLPVLDHRNHSCYDYDVKLIPIGSSSYRDYEPVCKISRSPFGHLDGTHSPFIRFVFDTSGLMVVEENGKWLKIGLTVIIAVGSFFTIAGFVDNILYKVIKKRVNSDYRLHAN